MSDNKRIFISWASKEGEEIATQMKQLMGSIFVNEKCFVSCEDIQRGSVGDAEIIKALDSACVGIFCLTQKNKERPWISYEAGYLAGRLSGKGIVTILFDFDELPQGSPLARHQYSIHRRGKKEYLKIVRSINLYLGETIANERIDKLFESEWDKFSNKITPIVERMCLESSYNNIQPLIDASIEKKSLSVVKNYSSPVMTEGESIEEEIYPSIGRGVSKDIADGYEDMPPELREARRIKDKLILEEKNKKEREKKEFIYSINHSYVEVMIAKSGVHLNSFIFAEGVITYCSVNVALELEMEGKVKINRDIEIIAVEALVDNINTRYGVLCRGVIGPCEKNSAAIYEIEGKVCILK